MPELPPVTTVATVVPEAFLKITVVSPLAASLTAIEKHGVPFFFTPIDIDIKSEEDVAIETDILMPLL